MDNNRIKAILFEIEKLWEKNSDQSLMELLHNVIGHNRDYRYMDDEVLLDKLVGFNDMRNNFGIKDSKCDHYWVAVEPGAIAGTMRCRCKKCGKRG